MSKIDYASFAQAMVRYFGRLEAAHGEPWTVGREAAEAWERLIVDPARESADLARCDELMLRGAHENGSGWTELKMFYDGWRGTAVPPPGA